MLVCTNRLLAEFYMAYCMELSLFIYPVIRWPINSNKYCKIIDCAKLSYHTNINKTASYVSKEYNILYNSL